jgi:SAM-dependent methyltransferase
VRSPDTPSIAQRPDALAPDRRSGPEHLIHRVPPAPVVDRLSQVLAYARGRSVIDLGFVDEGRMVDKRARRTWLHGRLAEVAGELVGIDNDSAGVALAAQLGYRAYAADCQSREQLAALELAPADVVLAGELIEHLDRHGDFLDAVDCLLKPSGRLIITTPNAARLINVLAALAGREVVNRTHVQWQSWRTLATLLDRHGWRLEELAYYANPTLPRAPGQSWRIRLRTVGVNALRRSMLPLFRLRPPLADGLLAVAARRFPPSTS